MTPLETRLQVLSAYAAAIKAGIVGSPATFVWELSVIYDGREVYSERPNSFARDAALKWARQSSGLRLELTPDGFTLSLP